MVDNLDHQALLRHAAETYDAVEAAYADDPDPRVGAIVTIVSVSALVDPDNPAAGRRQGVFIHSSDPDSFVQLGVISAAYTVQRREWEESP